MNNKSFDGVAFLLSIQDMNPLEAVLKSAAGTLRRGGRLVILMTHPCFRIPRQSGWGYDEGRRLQFRRIERYLSPLPVPMKQHRQGITVSFHRSLRDYVNALAAAGLLLDCLHEIALHKAQGSKAEKLASQEIPLLLGLRAQKMK